MIQTITNNYNNKFTHCYNQNIKRYSNISFGKSRPLPPLNIKSRGAFPASILSNFSKTRFIFDGIEIHSLEGFLQSLKTSSLQKQKEICSMKGFDAKMMSKSLAQPKSEILYFWNGKEYRKDSPDFKKLLEEVIKAQKENPIEGGFIFEGYKISSVNAFLLGLKTPVLEKQKELFRTPSNEIGKVNKSIIPIFDYRNLFWQGKTFSRNSAEYEQLLNRVYDARYENDLIFRMAIRQSKKYNLYHSKGKKDPRETILTEEEFLNQIRRLQGKDSTYQKFKDYIAYLCILLKNVFNNV